MRLANVQKVTLWLTNENEDVPPVETLVNAAASNGMHVILAESKEAGLPPNDTYASISDSYITLTTRTEENDG